MKKYILFTAIASVLSINAYAVSATVTSKDYVDTTRQATIPASGTNSETPGDTVVTYTDTAGTIGERGICDGRDNCGGDDLMTASAVSEATNFAEKTVTTKTCTEWVANTSHTDANCLLWRLEEVDVYGKCTRHSQCEWLDDSCPEGLVGACNTSTGKCRCSAA